MNGQVRPRAMASPDALAEPLLLAAFRGGSTAFWIIVHPHYTLPLDRGKSHKLLKKRRQKKFCNRSIFRLTRCFA